MFEAGNAGTYARTPQNFLARRPVPRIHDPTDRWVGPNGYRSKIAIADSRISKTDPDGTQKNAIERGGSIKVFPDANLAKGRAEYIQGVLKNSGLGAEHDYLQGPLLVRVTGNLSPSKAQDYERALG